MIYGIGMDLVKIERMKDAHEKWGMKFFEKVFTENEIEFVMERLNNRPRKCLGFKTPNQVFFNRLPVVALGS